jgi:hypothetical protein
MITDEMKFGKLRDEFIALIPNAKAMDLPVGHIKGKKGLIGMVSRAFKKSDYKSIEDCATAVKNAYPDGEIYVMYFDEELGYDAFKMRFMAVNGTNEAYVK